MADITIDGTISTSTARGMRSVVFTTVDIGYCFYVDSNGDFVYAKTTDGGATWGAAVVVATAATPTTAYDVWFDQWTPGDSGTLIHTWFFEPTNDAVYYRTLDTNGDTLGTRRTVFAGASVAAARGTFVSGTKTRSGYLYCVYDIDAGVEKGLHRSTDGGTTWSATLDATFLEATLDEAMLFPASNTGDNNDCWAVYYDQDADALTLKMWDSSAAAAVESATIQTHFRNTGDLTGQFGYRGAIRHSDGHLILAAVSRHLTSGTTANHQVYDINGTGSITELTAIQSSTANHYYPVVFIDQATDHIYVAYNGKRNGTESLNTATKAYYTKSTNGGSSWSAGDTAYMEDAAAVVLQMRVPPMGPRFFVGWRVGTTLLGNKVNSISFGADVTAPVLSAQTVNPITGVGGTPKVTTDEGNGTVYMVVVPDGNSPSVAQIKAGQNSSGGAALAAQNQAVTASGVQTFSAVTGLAESTAYDCWFVHTDAATNNSTAVKADFTTAGVAPILSAQTVATITSVGGVPKVTTDEGNGTAYMVVVPDGNSPSVAQMKAGQNSSGGAALAAQNQAVTGTGVQTFSAVTGLSPSTAYDVWFVHTDAATNNSTAVKADFTTTAAPPVLSAQTVDVAPAGMTPKVTTDVGNGTAYMVIVPNNDVPSVAQIKAGQQSSGAAATAAANQAVAASGQQTFAPVTTLQPNTAYDAWFVHTDAGALNSTAVKADFTTGLIRVAAVLIGQMMAHTVVKSQVIGQHMNEGPPVIPPGPLLEVAARRRRRPHWQL